MSAPHPLNQAVIAQALHDLRNGQLRRCKAMGFGEEELDALKHPELVSMLVNATVSWCSVSVNREVLKRLLSQVHDVEREIATVDRMLRLGASTEMVSRFYGLTHQEVALRRDILGLPKRKGRHPVLDEAQDTALWKRWKAGVTERSIALDDEMAMLAQRLALVGSASPKLHERLDRLTQKCRALAGTLRSRPQCGIHRDFYPDQLVVVDRQVYLLDLDLYSRGDPALDLGNFIAHVNENDLRRFGDPNRSSGLMQVLIDAYAGAHCDEQLRYAVAVYRVLSLARHIHISTLFSERSKFSEEILAWCESDTASLMRRRGMHMTSLERPQ